MENARPAAAANIVLTTTAPALWRGNAVHGSGLLFLHNEGLAASGNFAIDLVVDRLQRINSRGDPQTRIT